MGAWIRSRVGVAIIGAILIGGLAAAVGASTLTLRSSSLDGALADSGSPATATSQSTVTPEPAATSTPQPTATTAPRPTATPLGVGGLLRGTVLSTNPGANSFIMSRNGVHYTIQVDETTTYSGAATQLSGLH